MSICEEKYYYKLVNEATNEVDCYISADLSIKPKKLCETLGLNGYRAEFVSKEEYEENAEEDE